MGLLGVVRNHSTATQIAGVACVAVGFALSKGALRVALAVMGVALVILARVACWLHKRAPARAVAPVLPLPDPSRFHMIFVDTVNMGPRFPVAIDSNDDFVMIKRRIAKVQKWGINTFNLLRRESSGFLVRLNSHGPLESAVLQGAVNAMFPNTSPLVVTARKQTQVR